MEQDLLSKINKGQFFHLNQDFDKAILFYTEILSVDYKYEVQILKAQALTSLLNLEAAKREVDQAIEREAGRYEAYYRRAIIAFQEKQIDDAAKDFEAAKEKCGQNQKALKEIQQYLDKCEAEKNNKYQIKESEELKPGGKILSNSVNTGKVTFTWFQTPKSIGVELIHSLQNREDLKTQCTKKKLIVSFPLPTGEEYELTLDLFDRIVPENTKVNALLNKIEIILEKATSDLAWKQLEKLDKTKKIDQENKQNQVQAQSSYPSSNKTRKNWDKINKEIEVDMFANRDDYATGDPANALFSQIFQGSNDETRRAMMKSYQQSGGKALSTDWKDVCDKDYEGKDAVKANEHETFKKW